MDWFLMRISWICSCARTRKYDAASDFFEKYADRAPLFAMGKGSIFFLRAAMSLEPEDLQLAETVLGEAEVNPVVN